MSETELERLSVNMASMMQKLADKMDLNNQELRGSVKELFTAEAAVQRAAISEQFQAQESRVTNLETALANLMGVVKTIQHNREQEEDEPLVLKMLEYENVPDVEPEDMLEELYYELDYQRTLLLRDQEQLSRKLMEKLTAAQRSATTEQLRVQTERVATLNADFMYVQGQLTKEAALQGSVTNKQLLAQTEEGPEPELPGYEGIQELFIEEAAIQGAVISKQLPVQTDERADLELPEYEDIPDMSQEEMIEEYLKSRTEEEKEEDEEDGITPNDMIDYYLNRGQRRGRFRDISRRYDGSCQGRE